MITYVDYEEKDEGVIRIKSIEFSVPADGKNMDGVTYAKTVKIGTSGKTITTGK